MRTSARLAVVVHHADSSRLDGDRAVVDEPLGPSIAVGDQRPQLVDGDVELDLTGDGDGVVHGADDTATDRLHIAVESVGSCNQSSCTSCADRGGTRARPHRHRVHRPRRTCLRHLLAAARQPHRVPRSGDRRPRRQPDRRPAAAPRVGGARAGHPALHQLARRRHDRPVRHPRHDALRRARRRHDLRRSGGVGRGGAARRRHAGQAVRAAERPRADPPTARRRAGAVDRSRDPGRRGRRDADADGRHPPRGDRTARERSWSPTSTATTSCAASRRSPTASSTTSSNVASSPTRWRPSPPASRQRRPLRPPLDHVASPCLNDSGARVAGVRRRTRT